MHAAKNLEQKGIKDRDSLKSWFGFTCPRGAALSELLPWPGPPPPPHRSVGLHPAATGCCRVPAVCTQACPKSAGLGQQRDRGRCSPDMPPAGPQPPCGWVKPRRPGPAHGLRWGWDVSLPSCAQESWCGTCRQPLPCHGHCPHLVEMVES